jgi:hypothetical protein
MRTLHPNPSRTDPGRTGEDTSSTEVTSFTEVVSFTQVISLTGLRLASLRKPGGKAQRKNDFPLGRDAAPKPWPGS